MEAMAIFFEIRPVQAKAFSVLALVLCGFTASACAPRDAGVGSAVRHNTTLHVINPVPDYAGDVPEGASGERAALAQERYRTGAVKQPATIQTTSRHAVGGPEERP